MHDSNPTTMNLELVCGCKATLKKNITDGLDLVDFRRAESCQRHLVAPSVPASVIGFGPLWTWDANRAARRDLPAISAARFEPEHLYKLREGYFYINEAGKGFPGFGPIAKVHWADLAVRH